MRALSAKEAKYGFDRLDNNHSVGDGMQQALEHA